MNAYNAKRFADFIQLLWKRAVDFSTMKDASKCNTIIFEEEANAVISNPQTIGVIGGFKFL
jgi:predicted acetyltransferase